MDKLTPDLQSWLDNSEDEVFFYLRNNWPLFKRRDELRLELDDMMQFCVGSEKHEMFEDFRYTVENVLSIAVHRCWVQGMAIAMRNYLQQPVKAATELTESDWLGMENQPTIDEQRVQLYRFEEVHDAYLRLMDAVTSIYLPIVTDYVDNCLLLARWEYLCSFVHGYESCCNLLSRLGYSGGDEYLSQLYDCLAKQFEQDVFIDF